MFFYAILFCYNQSSFKSNFTLTTFAPYIKIMKIVFNIVLVEKKYYNILIFIYKQLIENYSTFEAPLQKKQNAQKQVTSLSS